MDIGKHATVGHATPKEQPPSNADKSPHTTTVRSPTLMGLQEKPEMIQQVADDQLKATKPSESPDNPVLLELQETLKTTQEKLLNAQRKDGQSHQIERKTTEGSSELETQDECIASSPKCSLEPHGINC